MAGVRNSTQRREVNIGAGMDTSAIATAVQQITGSLKGLTAEISNISRATSTSMEPMQQSLKKVADTSGLAGAAVMGMTGIIQDSNYGIRGMANNIQFVVPLLGQLIVQSEGVGNAFKSIWKGLMGPLGVMMAFSTGITILERFSMRKKEVAKESEKAGNQFIAEGVQAQAIFGYLEKLVRTNGDLNEIKKTAKEINDKYNTTLNTERVTLDDIAKQYTKVAEAIKIKSKLAIAAKESELGAEKAFEAEKSLIKLNQELNDLKDKQGKFNLKIQSQNEKYDEVTADITEKEKEIAKAQKIKQDAINQQNIGIAAQVGLMDKLKAVQPIVPKTTNNSIGAKEVENAAKKVPMHVQLFNEAMRAEYEAGVKARQDVMDDYRKNWVDPDEMVIDLGEIEVRGETFNTEPLASKFETSIQQLSDQMKAMLQTYVVDVVVSIGDLIGQALVMGGDAFKGGKEDMLKGFADFLGKLGGMMIAFGITLSAFWEGLKNPANAGIVIAAGIAAVVAAGAIKGYLKKQSNSNSIGSAGSSNGGGGNYSNGYNDNEMYVYSRLDGRDLVLSNHRSQYQMKR